MIAFTPFRSEIIFVVSRHVSDPYVRILYTHLTCSHMRRFLCSYVLTHMYVSHLVETLPLSHNSGLHVRHLVPTCLKPQTWIQDICTGTSADCMTIVSSCVHVLFKYHRSLLSRSFLLNVIRNAQICTMHNIYSMYHL